MCQQPLTAMGPTDRRVCDQKRLTFFIPLVVVLTCLGVVMEGLNRALVRDFSDLAIDFLHSKVLIIASVFDQKYFHVS